MPTLGPELLESRDRLGLVQLGDLVLGESDTIDQYVNQIHGKRRA